MKNRQLYNKENIEILIRYCECYINVFDTFTAEVTKQKLNPIQIVTADFLIRSRTTVEGVKALLTLFEKHPHHKMSIFLLLRSLASDILTYLCLLTFEDEADNSQTAFKNEVDWFDLDFLKEMLKQHELNESLRNIDGVSQLVSSNDNEKNNSIKKELLDRYRHLLNAQGKPKGIKEIRATTNNKHFKRHPEKKIVHFSNEKDKYERIITYQNYKLMSPVYAQFKYFSQFHHYSRGSMFFFEHNHLDYDIVNMMVLFTSLYTVAELQYRKLMGPDNKYSQMLNQLDTILNDLLVKL